MYYHDFRVVFQEVPGEISICFSISGCSLQCNGCHSPYLWKEGCGIKLTEEHFNKLLEKYKSLATCILFMGGEWHKEELILKLKLAKRKGYKTCLYTGQVNISEKILKNLTWVKTGKWDQDLGGLSCSTTNQKFIEVKTNKLLNHLFIKN